MPSFPIREGLIRPGQFGRVRGVIDTAENAILVPQLAVMEQQSAKTVYVVEDGNKVAVRTVVLGERFENLTIVKEGLKPGERVITEGMQKVRPGMTVAPTEKSISDGEVNRKGPICQTSLSADPSSPSSYRS